MKLIPLIPKRVFWTCICPFLMIFSTKFYDKRDDSDFEIVLL